MSVDMKKAKELREQGLTFKEIAKSVGCSEGHLRTVLKGLPKGVHQRPETFEEKLKRVSKELSELVKTLN